MPALSVGSRVLGVGARGRARADVRVRREFEVKIMRLGEKRIKARALENESIRPVVLELGPRQNPSRASRELRDPWESGCEAGPVCAPGEEGSVGASLRAHQVPGGFEDLRTLLPTPRLPASATVVRPHRDSSGEAGGQPGVLPPAPPLLSAPLLPAGAAEPDRCLSLLFCQGGRQVFLRAM